MIEKIKKAYIEGLLIQKTIRFIFIGLPIRLIRKIHRLIGFVLGYIYSKHLKTEDKKIVFMTYSNDYTCNPKYIAEEILRQGLPWDLVWLVSRKDSAFASHFPPQIRQVKRGSYAGYREIATAKIWIDNALNFLWDNAIIKKDNQIYIQPWHGSMGIKRMGKDDVKNIKWVKIAEKCSQNTSFCISNSAFEDEVYRTTYWPTTPILRYGHPRNDCFFIPEKMSMIRKSIIRQYELSEEDHILLYAPTFRDNGHLDCYDIDFAKLADTLESKFGGRWKIFIRMHFHDRKKKLQEDCFPECVVNVTKHPDMQDLLMAADVGLTDYSSWAYDFVLTRRPLFIFATDLVDYNKERGFYYPLESTPFPIATNNKQLIENIDQFDNQQYQKRVNLFLMEKGCVEDGHASEKVVELIKKFLD